MSAARAPGGGNPQDAPSAGHKRRNLSLANITVPLRGLSILKRKPLPANSPVNQKRSASLDSPKQILLQQPPPNTLTPIASPGQGQFLVRDLDRNPHGTTPLVQPEPTPTSLYAQSTISPIGPLRAPKDRQSPRQLHNRNNSAPVARSSPRHDRTTSTRSAKTYLTEPSEDEDTATIRSSSRARAMSSLSSQKGSNLRLNVSPGGTRDELDPLTIPKTPVTPGRSITSFFGFGKSPGPDTPSTQFSGVSQPVSPMPGVGPTNGFFGSKAVPAALDIPKANASQMYYGAPTPGFPSPPITSTHVADLEQELRELSTELANSLRREMELEDELERAQAGANNGSLDAGRRTSDYYSDSGAGSVRYPGDSEGKIEQLERMRRAAEQEKAQLKVQMSDRLQDALNGRREAEERVLHLHERVKSSGNNEPHAQNPRELAIQLEETKRKLVEEAQFRQNFQDLVGGMRLELEQLKNERDNLRDEVVPQLRTKLEGLEGDSDKTNAMSYEHARMSQELQTLRIQVEMHQQGNRFASIDEEGSPMSPGLSRSRSLATRGRGSRSNSLARSGSIKEKTLESKESLAQRVKDTEIQRDALHKALKSLLDRHMVNEKKHKKHVKQLEKDLTTAQNLTPRRTVFHEEVKSLKDEINVLRRRADDAMDQKWQLEKNFSGVKMDLDRAREETTDLRSLLEGRDIFMPERPGSRDGTKALDKAYKELRTTHALSIAHLKDLTGGANADSQRTLELLKQSISSAEAERDSAQSRAEEYREKARNLQKSELEHLNKEQSLSAELYASAQRMDDLANQVEQQIQSNSSLRSKLADAIERGEREQKNSTTKISGMQSKLRDLEEQLIAAQQQSEDMIGHHEQEVNELKDAHNDQLQRTKASLAAAQANLLAPKNPIKRVSMADATKTGALEARVRELERALSDAESEMGEVVGRMTKAQMDVAELQSERDDAMMQSRRLQAEYLKEREKVQQLMLAPDTF